MTHERHDFIWIDYRSTNDGIALYDPHASLTTHTMSTLSRFQPSPKITGKLMIPIG